MTRGARPDQGPMVVLAVGGLVAAVLVWAPVAGARPPGYTPGAGPIAVALGLATGDIAWTAECTRWLAGLGAAVAGPIAAGVAGWRWIRRRRTRVDKAARSMGRRGDVAHLTGRRARQAAARLQPRLAGRELTAGDVGPALLRRIGPIGAGEVLHAALEDVVLVFAGPRAGKTLTLGIPHVVAHTGSVIATSNRRDIVDATVGPRGDVGRVWVFDPQRLALGDVLGEQGFWFDVLAGCERLRTAERYAGILAAAERPADAKVDAHFDTSARELIALLLQAAAVGGRTIADVYRWSMDSEAHNPEPVRLLGDGGHPVSTEALLAKYHEPDKMRGSTFGTARTMLGLFTDPDVVRWVTPQPGLPQFDPAGFVTSACDTLYLLSEGGPGSPAPLLAVLNDALTEAGKIHARLLGGRLDPPVLVVMDEAANIVRDPDLPRKVTYYGGSGMPLVIILQAYSQGESVWGRTGMESIWSAANHLLYLGKVRDDGTLERLSRLIGEHDVPVWTTQQAHSWLSGAGQASRSTRRDRILPVADLAALPTGRAVLFSGGAPPVLGETLPWTTGPYASEIRASIARYAPAGEREPDDSDDSDGGADTPAPASPGPEPNPGPGDDAGTVVRPWRRTGRAATPPQLWGSAA